MGVVVLSMLFAPNMFPMFFTPFELFARDAVSMLFVLLILHTFLMLDVFFALLVRNAFPVSLLFFCYIQPFLSGAGGASAESVSRWRLTDRGVRNRSTALATSKFCFSQMATQNPDKLKNQPLNPPY